MFVFREVVYKPRHARARARHRSSSPSSATARPADVDMTFLRECTKFVPYSPMMAGETEPGF